MHIRILFLLFLLPIFNIFAQSVPLTSTDKANERGYSESASTMTSGNEIISDYDGNLCLNYSTHINLPNDLSCDFTLTYNANVEHKFFIDGDTYKPIASINLPEWILGIKGFAIQTLNMETKFNTKFDDVYHQAQGHDLPLLIPGYSYCNRLIEENKGIDENLRYDYIQILMADGSKTTLYNRDGNSAGDIDQGLYEEKGPDKCGFAIVKRMNDLSPYYRQMWYKPGDGLTYYFEETSPYYIDRPTVDRWAPKYMQLKEIISPTGDKLIIYYDYLNSSLPYERLVPVSISYKKNSLSYDESEISLKYTFQDLGNTNSIQINNYNSHEEYYIESKFPGFFYSADEDKINYGIGYVSQISNKNNKFPTIINYSVLPDYSPIYVDYNYGSNGYKLKVFPNLPSSIQYYNGKKTEFDYWGRYFNSNVTGNLDIGPTSSFRYSTDNINYAYRDCYTNFMIKERRLYNKFDDIESRVKTEQYKYIKEVDHPGFAKGFADNIITQITETDHTQNITTLIRKNFSKFRTGKYYFQTGDRNTNIKLMEESIEEYKNEALTGDYVKKIYGYDLGNAAVDEYPYLVRYTGTFDLTSVTEKKVLNGNSIEKVIKAISYTPDNTQGASIVPPQNGKALKKTILKSDNNSLYNYTKFINVYPSIAPTDIPGLFDFANSYYKVGIPIEEKVFSKVPESDSLIKSSTLYGYELDTSSPLVGKLTRLVQNYNSKDISKRSATEYTYYSTDLPQCFGLIKTESLLDFDNNSSRILKTYSYSYDSKFNPQTVNTSEILYDGSKTAVTKYFPTSNLPYKVSVDFDNNSKNYTTYTAYYSETGNIWFNIDENNNYYQYDYDNYNRIQTVYTPYSFCPSSEKNDQIGYYSTEDVLLDSDNKWSYTTVINDCATRPSQLNILLNNGPFIPTDPPNGSPLKAEDYTNKGNTDKNNIANSMLESCDPRLNRICYIDLNTPFFLDNDNIENVESAILTLGTYDCHLGGPNESNKVVIWGMTQGSGWGDPVTFSFIPSSNVSIDVSGLIQQFIDAKKNLYGFHLTSSRVIDPTTDYKSFGFNPGSTKLTLKLKRKNVIPITNEGSIVNIYDDSKNTISVINRVGNKPEELAVPVVTKKEFDALGQLRRISRKNTTGDFETKSTASYSTAGNELESKDALNRQKNTSYDFLNRPIEIKFGDANKQTIEYYISNSSIITGDGLTYYTDYNVFTDESGNKKYTYFDYVGNKVAEQIGNNKPTIFKYDNLYRLIQVVSPENKKTTYVYDNILGYIKSKTTPDEGQINYKYDKYGNLRFTQYTNKPNEVTFNSYDALNHLISTGVEKNFTGNFESLDPDKKDNAGLVETDQSKLVLVNMYDGFTSTGIFTNCDFHGTLENLKGKVAATAYKDKPDDPLWKYKLYSYDALGRVIETYMKE